MKIAVVGTGIAGLSTAYVLSRAHEVELFEANGYPGGHTHTVDCGSLAIDTGFIVHNTPNYPLLTRFLAELGVETQPTVMSFSMSCACGASWSSRRPWRAKRLLFEIVRFLRTAGTADTEGKTFDRWLRDEGYSDRFRWHYLVPMTSALWSAPPGQALEVPAAFGVQFFRNHGMLGLRRHRWRSVVGGSSAYVRTVLERIGSPLHLGLPVRKVVRKGGCVLIQTDDEPARRFDAAVIATHAPTALDLLGSPTPDELRLLGAFGVTGNEVVLHSDSRFLPRRASDRSGWNYQSPGCGVGSDFATVTYSMNRLQSLDAPVEWCVTLNRTAEIDPAAIKGIYRYDHPQMTFEAFAAQRELGTLNTGRLAFAGAWQGYGFHEDGIRSGVAAAASLGVTW